MLRHIPWSSRFDRRGPTIRTSLATDWGHNLPVSLVRRRINAGRFGISAVSAGRGKLGCAHENVRLAMPVGDLQGDVFCEGALSIDFQL
jgi:hypothetical protein